MRLVLPREPPAPQQQSVDPQASSAISFRAHRTRGEEDQARSLPDSSPAFTSDAAARGVRCSHEEGVAAAGSGGERAAGGRGQWWQEERRGSECGAARSSHSPKVQENENRWLQEDERANSEARGGSDNSEDEAGGPSNSARRRELTEQELFELLHRTKGFKVKNMEQDGNCLFRAISDQIYGDPGMHEEVPPSPPASLRAQTRPALSRPPGGNPPERRTAVSCRAWVRDSGGTARAGAREMHGLPPR